MLRFKILQVRLEHAEEKIDIVGRLRDFEDMLISFFIRETDSQGQLARDEINRAQPKGELLEKPPQHEEQRLRCFDLVLELEALLKRFRRQNKFQEPRRCAIGPFPKPDRFRPKPDTQIFIIQRRQLPQRLNPPFVQDRQDLVFSWVLGVGR